MTKGIVLAGGTGSRLGPLSRVTNKHLLPVGPVPMIYYPIAQLLCNNIREICIVSGLFHLGSVVSLLGSGSRFNCEFTYKVQDEAGGIAEALNLCRHFAGLDSIAVFLGDNIFGNVLDLNIDKRLADATLFLKKVPDPHRFGIAEVDHMKKLIDVEEKPENPKSNLAITGAYLYSSKIWKAIDSIERSARGELEISDANKWILRNGVVLTKDVEGWWSDAGTQDSYKKSNSVVWDSLDEHMAEVLDKMMKV
jgi:glucose-1-phosphate thymidylyltransferase